MMKLKNKFAYNPSDSFATYSFNGTGRQWKTNKFILVFIVLLLTISKYSYAAEPDVNAIIRSLAPIRYLPEHGGQVRPSIDLVIQFEVGSAKLTTPALNIVNKLAIAIQSKDLQSSQFEIRGHTDASGKREDNQRLSEKRALVVVDQLVTVYKVDKNRLTATGMGEDQLKDPLAPFAARNRRVEIINSTQVKPEKTSPDITKSKSAIDILTGN